MSLLNEPLGYDERGDDPEWSPAIGLRRGLVRGVVAAAVLSLLLVPLAAFAPYMILPWLLRTPLTFGLAWLMFLFVERAAGFMSPRIIALTLLLTFAVLCSNHFVLGAANVHGAGMAEEWWIFPANLTETILGDRDSKQIGWGWLHPYVLITMNLVPVLVGGGFCAALKTRG